MCVQVSDANLDWSIEAVAQGAATQAAVCDFCLTLFERHEELGLIRFGGRVG